uniref:Uncharacterized protein n=1 Tax=Knipowitschia caucasica TaxID=637954 RepID=A0AAV2J158_KNICA
MYKKLHQKPINTLSFCGGPHCRPRRRNVCLFKHSCGRGYMHRDTNPDSNILKRRSSSATNKLKSAAGNFHRVRKHFNTRDRPPDPSVHMVCQEAQRVKRKP